MELSFFVILYGKQDQVMFECICNYSSFILLLYKQLSRGYFVLLENVLYSLLFKTVLYFIDLNLFAQKSNVNSNQTIRSLTQKLIESIIGRLFKFSVLAYKNKILYFAVRLKLKFDLKVFPK